MKYKLLLIFAFAIQINAIELPIYEARYSYESEEINIKGIRKFQKNSDDYSLGFKAKNLFASMSFESNFSIEESQIISKDYIIKVKPRFIDRDQEISFDYDNQTINSLGRDAWSMPLDTQIGSADPLNAQIQIRLNLLKGLEEFSIRLLEIKNGEMEDNYYKIVRNESCMLSDIKYECAVLKRFREKENRETLYYLIPDLDYMFLKIIDSGPKRNQKLELLEILSLG